MFQKNGLTKSKTDILKGRGTELKLYKYKILKWQFRIVEDTKLKWSLNKKWIAINKGVFTTW